MIKSCENCLHKCESFDKLQHRELAVISAKKCQIDFKAGETIAKMGTFATDIITLESGYAKAYYEEKLGGERIVKIYKPKELIGVSALFNGHKHPLSVAAITDVTACMLDSGSLRDAALANPKFGEALFGNISGEFNYTVRRFAEATQKQMAGRMADGLLYLSQQIFEAEEFDMLISRQDLANFTGMAKESVSRLLRTFKTDGVIDLDGRRVRILNMKKLKQVSDLG